MKLKVLVDNNTYIDQYYLGEPAVCYYIEDEGKKILLDIGYSQIVFDNAKKMNVNMEEIDVLAISHGHEDHTKGLEYYFNENRPNLKVVAHPDAFKEKRIGKMYIGSPFSEEEMRDKCDLLITKNPVKISENITFLGQIPVTVDFEQRYVIGKQKQEGEMVDDYMVDDTALAYKTDDGIYIITGCSHSGICNIIEYAKKVLDDNRVLGVIGGFHLFKVNDRVNKTIEYLKQSNIKDLYPCHCTSLDVKVKMANEMVIKEVGVGLEIEW